MTISLDKYFIMPATAKHVIAGLYAAFFNRAPDAAGLNYWEGLAAGGNDLSVFNSLAAGFASHPKFTDIYSGMTSQQFVEAIYVNALGYEGDSEGIAYWTSFVAENSRSDMVASFVHSALNVDLSDPSFDYLSVFERDTAQNRQDTLFNKANVGLYFATTLAASSNIVNSSDLDSDPAYIHSINALANIDNLQPSVVAAMTLIDSMLPLPNASWDIPTPETGGRYAWQQEPFVPSIVQIQFSDFDGDGIPDILTAGTYFDRDESVPMRILINDGEGNFIDSQQSMVSGDLLVSNYPKELVAADFNGDGIDDVFVANHGYDQPPYPGFQNQLLLSTGAGEWVNATSTLPQQADFSHSVTAGDVDGDGDIDIFVGNIGEGPSPDLLLNDGSGNFTRSESLLPDTLSSSAPYISSLFVDISGDGNLDLVLGADHTGTDRVYINSGSGDFSSTYIDLPPSIHSATGLSVTVDIQSRDIDGDGDADLILSQYNENTAMYLQVLRNDSGTNFTDVTNAYIPNQPVSDDWAQFLQFIDLNNDGYDDIYTIDGGGRYFLNDGFGVWSGFGRVDPGNAPHSGLPAHDYDQDGDVEIILYSGDGLFLV